MTSTEFCYWLKGKIEIDGEPKALTAKQVKMISAHLDLVFTNVTSKLKTEKVGRKSLADLLNASKNENYC